MGMLLKNLNYIRSFFLLPRDKLHIALVNTSFKEMKNYGKIIQYFFPLRKEEIYITGKAPVNKSYFVLTTVTELYTRLVLTCANTLKMLPFEELRSLHST